MNDTANPPIAPTAKGYQKASLKLIINGKKPIMVEMDMQTYLRQEVKQHF